jgi:hypothetical protein
VLTVDHLKAIAEQPPRFALSNPALVLSAPSKKSFSSVRFPILAWSDFTPTVGVAGVPRPDPIFGTGADRTGLENRSTKPNARNNYDSKSVTSSIFTDEQKSGRHSTLVNQSSRQV